MVRSICYIVIFALCNTLAAAKPFKPLSYTITLTANEKRMDSIFRTLALAINGEVVGAVTYEIQLNNQRASFIHQLHVAQSHRKHKGYGKVLLYQALKDIVQSGSTFIELERYPFDLKPSDDRATRDAQLIKWYREFGFQQKGNNLMKLNLARLLKTEVVSSFSDDGITFTFRKSVNAEHHRSEKR